jgi:hypothetical protein
MSNAATRIDKSLASPVYQNHEGTHTILAGVWSAIAFVSSDLLLHQD